MKHYTLKNNRMGLGRKHIPVIAVALIILLIAAWLAFFGPAFTTIDGLNQ